MQLKTDWCTDNVTMQFAGAKTQRKRELSLTDEGRALCERSHVHALVKYSASLGLVDTAVLILAS